MFEKETIKAYLLRKLEDMIREEMRTRGMINIEEFIEHLRSFNLLVCGTVCVEVMKWIRINKLEEKYQEVKFDEALIWATYDEWTKIPLLYQTSKAISALLDIPEEDADQLARSFVATKMS